MRLYVGNPKSVIVSESSLRFLVNEALSSKVYHFTDLTSMYHIAKDNRFYLQSGLGGVTDNYSRDKMYYMSLTRQKSVNFGYSYQFRQLGVRICFDGDKLSHNFSGKPIDYYGNSKGKYARREKEDFRLKQNHRDVESEDRLFSKKPYIDNVSEYIERVDILINKEKYNEEREHDEMLLYIYHILVSSMSGKVFVYDNPKDFDAQNENTINKSIKERSGDFYNRSPKTYKGMMIDDALRRILQVMLVGEVDFNLWKQESAKLLKKYGLEKFITRKLMNDINYISHSVNDLIFSVSSDIKDFSRYPSEDKSKAIRMFTDYMRGNDLGTYRELLRRKTMMDATSSYDLSNLMDTDKRITFLTANGGYGKRYIVLDPDRESFWNYVKDKSHFVQSLYDYTRYKHNSQTDASYKRYLTSLTRKNISVNAMLGILRKFELSEEDIEYICNWIRWEEVEMNVFRAYDYKIVGKSEKESMFIIRKMFEKKD